MRASRTAPVLILLALTIGVFWKIALTGQYTWLNSGDMSEQVLPFLQEEAAQWHHGQFPLWDPHHWAGQSLIGQDQPGVLFPLNWLLSLTPLWHGQITLPFANWYFVLIHFFAAWFGFLLARDLGLSSFASICTGASFGLSGYMGNTDWPQMLNGGMWAPLVLLFAIRALNGRRPIWNMALAGSIAGFSFYGGHHQIPTYTVLSVASLLVFYAVFRGARLLSISMQGAVMVVFTVLVSAPQLLPSLEYWTHALRWVSAAQPVGFHDKVPYVVFDLYSMNPVVIFGLIVPSPFPNVTPFVGVTILTFALVGVAANWRSRMVPAFAGLAIAAFLFSLGKYSVFHGVLYALLPLLDKSRNAAFAMFILNLAVAVLAGFGIDCFMRERERIAAKLRVAAYALLALGSLLFAFLIARGIFQGEKMFEYPPFALLALSALLLACIFQAWRLGHMPERAAVVSILGLIFFDIGMVTSMNYPHHEQGWRYVDKLSAFDDLADFLRQQPGYFRITKNADDIGFNFGDWYGFDEYGGMGAGITENMANMNGAANSLPLLGVSYYLGHEPHNSDPEPLFRGRAGVNVYRVPGAFPRAWAVHAIESIQEPRQRQAHLNVPLDQLARKTFVLGPAPKLDSCAGSDSVRITKLGATEVELEAGMACTGMVVVSNNFFPGWRAEVDGTSAQIYEAYSFVQGVVVSGGKHRLRLHYVPSTLYEGLGLAALGVAGLLVAQARVRNVT